MSQRGRDHFSASYAEARARFRHAVEACGATRQSLPLEATAPDGSPLAIDIAWLGTPRAERLVVHSSGLHGVEGFAGAAVQLALLAEPPVVPAGAALALVHVLNPYGMSWLRRVNEGNVDLNRNFGDAHAAAQRAAPEYARVDALLNPPTPPARDGFYLRAAGYLLRFGARRLRQAVVEGQYAYPRGLFYGGAATEPGPARYRAWLEAQLAGAARVCAVDVHTGLGRWGEELLFLRAGGTDSARLSRALGRRLRANPPADGSGYDVRGGYANAFAGLAPETVVLTQEFGTYGGLRVMHALREENRAHHHAGAPPAHPAKQRLKEMFAPADGAWRDGVVVRGGALARDVMRYAFAQ